MPSITLIVSIFNPIGAFALVSGVMTGNVVQQVLSMHGQEVPDVTGGEPPLEPGQIPSIAIANAIGFVIGCYCAVLGCFRLGFISNYLSEQLISGFTTSASFYVFTSQVRYLLGLHLPYRSGLIAVLRYFFNVYHMSNIRETDSFFRSSPLSIIIAEKTSAIISCHICH